MDKCKFRIWSKEQNAMVFVTEIPNIGTVEGYEYMPYTGIEDSKGISIFKGDIVKFKKHGKDYVGFINYIGCEWLIDGIYKLARECKKEIEVIGNVFEDPKMIEEYWK